MQAGLVPHEGLIEQLYHPYNFPCVDIPRGGWPSKLSAGFLRHEHTLSPEDACCKAFRNLNRPVADVRPAGYHAPNARIGLRHTLCPNYPGVAGLPLIVKAD
jgi:hypothetical protein